jgi:hypothetical protein
MQAVALGGTSGRNMSRNSDVPVSRSCRGSRDEGSPLGESSRPSAICAAHGPRSLCRGGCDLPVSGAHSRGQSHAMPARDRTRSAQSVAVAHAELAHQERVHVRRVVEPCTGPMASRTNSLVLRPSSTDASRSVAGLANHAARELARATASRMGSAAATVIWIGRAVLRTYLARSAQEGWFFGGRGPDTHPRSSPGELALAFSRALRPHAPSGSRRARGGLPSMPRRARRRTRGRGTRACRGRSRAGGRPSR